MKAVNQNAFDDIPFKKMRMLDGVRGDEVEIIRVEVFLPDKIVADD